MKFTYKIDGQESGLKIKDFLANKNYSNKLIKSLKIKEGAGVWVNGSHRKMYEALAEGDQLQVIMPVEKAHPHIQPAAGPLDILFEDDHLLIINKPAGLLSNPSFNYPQESISNRVLHYFKEQGYENQTIHLVTRLDRQSSGILVYAKHSYAHALMDRLLRVQGVERFYLAACGPSHSILDDHGEIDFPIGRSEQSIIERCVRSDGKASLTEYWRLAQSEAGDLFKVQLHTGRTHQIRVHFSHLGLPLLGDELYGAPACSYFDRQALHCWQMSFIHPFKHERLTLKAPLSLDFQAFIDQIKSTRDF